MKKFLIYILFISVITSISAQSDVRFNNYWWKTSIINPAYMSTDHLAEFDLAYRNQWTLFPGAPKTLYASGAYYIDDLHTKIGVRILGDYIGYTTTTAVDLIYSYATKLNYEWRVTMGLAFSYQNQAYDISKIDAETPTDPAILNLLVNQSRLNADVGFEFTNDTWLFGIVGRNLASLFRDETTRFNNINTAYVIYKQPVNTNIDFTYGISGIQTKNVLQGELNFTSHFKVMQDRNAFQLGAFYRTWNEMGAMFGIDLGQNLRLYYNYDFNVGGISRSSIGSHEIMISYSLDKVYKCNCWY